MPSPDEFNDFSHLPTVDEVRDDSDGGASALWKKHRRTEGQMVAKPTPAAEPEPAHEPAAWHDLLEMEAEEPPLEVRRPPSTPRRLPEVGRLPPRSIPNRVTAPQEVAPPPPAPADSPPPQPDSPPVEKAEVEEHRRTPIPLAPVPLSREKLPVETPAEAEAPADSQPAPEEGDSQKEAAAKEDSPETPPAAPPAVKIEEGATPKSPWQHRWEKIGGRALTLSVGVHLLLLAGATLYVVNQALDPQIDFLPGGGTVQGETASQDLEHKIQQKKSPWLKKSMPVRRLAALDKVSDMVLPDTVPDVLDLPKSSDPLSGKLGAGMGLAGAGGGFGKGMGLGSRSGMVFQPFSMFGMEIKAKRLALVLDVSASMAPHLPRVIAELDKVARGSVVVLFYGCGLEPPPPGKPLEGVNVYRTSGIEFEKFWRMGGATLEEARQFKFNPKDVIPSEDIFRLLSRRPQTYFIHEVQPNITGYTWLALLSSEVRSADALYWFSDFQDRVEFQQIGIVRENLKNRKQKLYIHAYQRGSSFDLVKSQLVEPTGGDFFEEE
ncbi:MAG: hypothetical protein U0984_05535 [Prosthecobacter sp.]|nr:hypothetical protein [Prosthecobacter sp.]